MSGQEDQDSWDSGPGSPSRASSPLGSREDLHESSERLGGGSYVCEETEEEEIMSEFRELYKGVGSMMMYDCSTESLNSSSFEDTEKLKARLHSLKRYVYDLKESYDELLKAFSLLEIGAKGRVAELEKTLTSKIDQAKDLGVQVDSLQSQLSEAQSQVSQIEEMNQQLSVENSQLSDEKRGLLEHVRQDDGGRAEMVEQDLGHVLQLISDGVTGGILKLTEVSLRSQTSPLPAKDLPLGHCNCGTTLDNYKSELSTLRDELTTRLTDLQALRGELTALQGEHDETLEELGRSRKHLEATQHERNQLESQLSDAQETTAVLQDEVSSLTAQLNEALERQQSLSAALDSTREAMEMYHTTARQEVEHKDQELTQLTFELSTLDQKRQSLERQVTYSQQQVQNLEASREYAQGEITSLQDEVQRLEGKVQADGASTQEVAVQVKTIQQDLLDKGLELETVKEEKDQLEKELASKVADLQTQISDARHVQNETAMQASSYEQQLESLQSLYAQCQEEAGKVRAILEAKEAELSRMLTSLQVAAAQISALHSRDEEGPRSPGRVSEELTQCEQACQAVEKELLQHRKRWEETVLNAEQHKAVIDELNSKQDVLEEEVVEREKRVNELEALVAEVNSSRDAMCQTVSEYEESLAQLQTELESTTDQYQEACNEIDKLKHQLASSSGALEEKEQLLINELQKRDTLIHSLEAEEKELKEKCRQSSECAGVTERAREALQQEYERVLQELESRESEVCELESRVEDEGAKEREEVERCSRVIQDLKKQLQDSQEQRKASLELATSSENELSGLRDEHACLVEQLSLRDEVLKRLEEETGLLKQQYQEALDDVNVEQELVESLQEELASSQGLSDGLQQEVSECDKELKELQDSLYANEQERIKLQKQVLDLTKELEAAQDELSSERAQHVSLQRTTDSAIQAMRDEIELFKVEQSRGKAHQDILERTVDEQRSEMVELRLAMSALELQKESLLFQSSTNEGTIGSLKSQLSTLESALRDAEEKCQSLEEDLRSSLDHRNLLESQLAMANDKVYDTEHSKSVVESVSSERLNEITHLHKQLEEERVRDGLVNELKEQVASLENQLASLQDKHDSANAKVREADRSRVAMETFNAEQDIALSQLEQELERVKGYEAETHDLREQVADLEEQLTSLHTELEVSKDECLSLQSLSRTSQEKEHHWSRELSQTSAQLRLAQERVEQLEREARGREGAVRELQVKLESAQCTQAARQEEASDNESVLNELEHQLSDKHQDMLHLQHQLDCCRSDLDSIRGQLATSEDARRQLLDRLGSVEDQYDRLQRTQSETAMELSNTRANLHNRKEQCEHLQTDCEHMTERVSSWAKDQKTNSEVLADRIREQEAIIVTLRSTNQELELRNNQLSSQTHPSLDRSASHPDMLASRDSSATSLTGHPSITRLTAMVDVDITNIPGVAGVVTATSTIPITFGSQYRSTMEKGLSSSSCVDCSARGGGSETESEAAALDKDYWIRRAGELSVQLQQSSEYWTQKVRELSIDLEKCKQAHRHID